MTSTETDRRIAASASAGSDDVPAPPDVRELELRKKKVRTAMADGDIDLVLAFAPGWRRENVRYLSDTGVQGSAAAVMLGHEGEPVGFSTRKADLTALTHTGWVRAAHFLQLPDLDVLVDHVREARPRRIAVAHLELMPSIFTAAIRRAVADVEIVSGTALMDAVRMVKSAWELSRMRKSATVCAAGWQKFVEVLEPGLPEYRIVAGVESELKRMGAEDNFMLIASGGDEVLGMTPPGYRTLRRGDMVRTELTPQMDGYWLQICRSAVLGEPSNGQKQSFELFNEAVEAGMSVVKPGVTCHEVAMAENDVFRRHGYGEYCSSRWTRVRGHGHGLHPDESPIVEGNHTVLPEGAVFIIHPNTYTPLAGYHVLGDPVVVTADGCEVLIDTQRRLFSSEEGVRA